MAIELTFSERRVLGVLVEKALTTPDQYPLTLNAAVNGCNQKSCREPTSHLGEEEVLDALDSLRGKGFTTLVRSEGSRTDRWKHRFSETLFLNGKEASILAELLLRGPQTDGELRQRASRMVPIASLEEVESLLDGLATRAEPLVVRLGPPDRRRGVKFAHTFYPPGEAPSASGLDEPALEAPTAPRPHAGPAHAPPPAPALPAFAAAPPPASTPAPGAPRDAPGPGGSGDVEQLRREVEALKARVTELEETFVRFLR